MKIHHIIVLLLLTNIVGCVSSRVTSKLPTIDSSKPTGTVYIGYKKHILPSGTRTIILDNDVIFSINHKQFTQFKLKPGKYDIRVGCISVKGWNHDKGNSSFNVGENDEVYFMIRPNIDCKRFKSRDLTQVTDVTLKSEIRSYKYFDLKQKAGSITPPAPTQRTTSYCCDVSGVYTKQEPLRGGFTVVQNGQALAITGHDIALPSLSEIMATANKPYVPGPEITIEAKLFATEIEGQWWFTSKPRLKKPFLATIGNHAEIRGGKVMYVGGELSSIYFRKNNPIKLLNK